MTELLNALALDSGLLLGWFWAVFKMVFEIFEWFSGLPFSEAGRASRDPAGKLAPAVAEGIPSSLLQELGLCCRGSKRFTQSVW